MRFSSSARTFRGSRVILGIGILGVPRNLAQIWADLHRSGNRLVHLATSVDLPGAQSYVCKVLKDLSESEAGMETVHAPHVVEFYSDVVRSSAVNVVYIALPILERDRWVRECIEARKHVVGGDPSAAAPDAGQLLGWLHGMSAARLLYLDGAPTAHGGLMMTQVAKLLGDLGRVRHVELSLVDRPTLARGVLEDLVWEAISKVLLLLNFAVPVCVSGCIAACAQDGSIAVFEAYMRFLIDGANVTVTLDCRYQEGRTIVPERHMLIIASEGALNVNEEVEEAGAVQNEARGGKGVRFRVVRSVLKPLDIAIHDTHQVSGPDAISPSSSAVAPLTIAMEAETTEEYLSAPSEGSGHAVWLHLRESLTQLGTDGRLLIDSDNGKYWGRRIYLTQLILDRLLQSAMSCSGVGKDNLVLFPSTPHRDQQAFAVE